MWGHSSVQAKSVLVTLTSCATALASSGLIGLDLGWSTTDITPRNSTVPCCTSLKVIDSTSPQRINTLIPNRAWYLLGNRFSQIIDSWLCPQRYPSSLRRTCSFLPSLTAYVLPSAELISAGRGEYGACGANRSVSVSLQQVSDPARSVLMADNNSITASQNRGGQVLAVTVAMFVAATFAVILRFISRVGVVKKISQDDYAMIVAWVSRYQGLVRLDPILRCTRSSPSASPSPSAMEHLLAWVGTGWTWRPRIEER